MRGRQRVTSVLVEEAGDPAGMPSMTTAKPRGSASPPFDGFALGSAYEFARRGTRRTKGMLAATRALREGRRHKVISTSSPQRLRPPVRKPIL